MTQNCRHGLRRSILIGLLCCGTAALGACTTFNAKLTSVDEKPFARKYPTADQDGVIEISVPQIYSRESLINDRRTEEGYIRKLLTESETIDFEPELVRDLKTISALAIDLGLAIDPAKRVEYEAAREQFGLESEQRRIELEQEIADLEERVDLGDLQRDIDRTRLEIELQQLRDQLETLRQGGVSNDNYNGNSESSANGDGDSDEGGEDGAEEGGNGDGGGGGGGEDGAEGGPGDTPAPTGLPSISAPDSRMSELQGRIDNLLDRLEKRRDLPRKVTPEPDPREDFRARQAYRRDLRATLAEARLDDVHDQRGQALYRLQFQATVAPGKEKRRWGVARLELQPPRVRVMDFFPGLYRTWLGHATYRLNQAENARRQGRLINPLYHSLEGVGAFSIRNVYYSPEPKATEAFDPCDKVSTESEAADLGCASFVLAMPPRGPDDPKQLLPIVKGTMLRLLVDRLRIEPRHIEVKNCRLFDELANLPQALPVDQAEELSGLLELAESLRNRQRSGEYDRILRHHLGEDGFRLYQDGTIEQLDEKALLLALIEMGRGLSIDEWFQVFPADDVLDFSIRTLRSSRALSASLQGLTSRRDLELAEADKVSSLLRLLGEVTGAAREFVDYVYSSNDCARSPQSDRERLWQAWEYEEYGTGIPVEFFRALALSWLGCEKAHSEGDWESECTLRGRAVVHATSPLQLSQRISTVASATKALQLAASVNATLTGKGGAAKAGLGLAKGATGQVEALERIPLVVGYSKETPAKDAPGHGIFGWVFGPRATLDPESDNLALEQTLQSYSLAADLVVPSWWPHVTMQVNTGWVGNWYSYPKKHLPGDAGELLDLGDSAPETITKELPLNRADLDNLTSEIAREMMAGQIQETEIYRVFPDRFSTCEGEVSLQIYGANVWRGSEVQLAGLPAIEGSVRVLPDMEGVSASFDLTKLPKGPQLRRPTLTVWTQSGFDDWELDLSENFDAAGRCVTAPLPAERLIRVSPAQIPRCAPQATVAVETAGVGIASARLGTATGTVTSTTASGRDRTREVTVDQDDTHHVTLVTFDKPHRANKGLDEWTLSLVTPTGKLFTSTLTAKGKPCLEEKAPRVIAVAPKTVSRCAPAVTLAVETEDFKIAHAFLGAVAGTKLEITGSGEKTFGHRITFINPAKGNEALSSWPLTLVAEGTGKVFTESIDAVGQPKTCEPAPAPSPPDLQVALPQSDSLNVCVRQESVTVAGKSASEVAGGELLGVAASAVTRPTQGTAVLTFTDLPVFSSKSAIPGATTLRVKLGTKVHELPIKLSCNP